MAAEVILYIGDSGSGKSTALRNLKPEETVIISPNSKSLPFPGGSKYVVGENLIQTSELDDIAGAITHISDTMPEVKQVILEDYTHFFNARIFSPKFMSRTQGGEAFQRWNDFGASVFNSIIAHQNKWRSDLIIVVLHHVELKETGTIGFKSSGKLLDNTIIVPSYVNYQLHGVLNHDEKLGTTYHILTRTDGVRDAKTPYGLFEAKLPNDLATILERVRAYREGKVEVAKI
jgi:energy-coupling factor transporter ATP-binding protein EcfA2